VSLRKFSESQFFDAKLPIVVFITSNYTGNTEMMQGCKENNIPCFGTLWDFVRILFSQFVDHSNGCCSENTLLCAFTYIYIYGLELDRIKGSLWQ
jgi:hypothetical protein